MMVGMPPHSSPTSSSDARPLLILKVGDTFADTALRLGDFEHWIAQGLQGCGLPVCVLDPRRGDALPTPATLAGVVITGSHAMVTDRAPWSEDVAHWLRQAVPAGLPTLGICYGHQVLAHALGGTAGNHPQGLELGTVQIERLPAAQHDVLFSALPDRFAAQVVHRQSALRLPPGAVPLAASGWEPHQAYRVGEQCWGVQFHPEFSAKAMQAYVNRLAPEAPQRKTVTDTPDAASLLPRFGELVRTREARREMPQPDCAPPA